MPKNSTTIPVIGLCRFSYPTLDGTGFKSSSKQEIYSTERLIFRTTIFENILIPSIAGQTEKDFLLGILIGSDLPSWCKERVRKSCQNISQIRIIEHPPLRPHTEACSEAIISLRPDTGSPLAEFRIDDDDGLSINFVKRVKEIFSSISVNNFGPILELDFPKGYHLNICREPTFYETLTPHLTCAQAWLIKPKRDRTLFNHNHFRFWTKGPSISIPHDHMYIRGIHGFNDSNAQSRIKHSNEFPYNSSIHRQFNVSLDNIHNISRSLA